MTKRKGTFAEQLNRVRSSFSLVQPVSQVLLTIPKARQNDTYKAVRDEILRWTQNRAGKRLPKEAWDGDSFELVELGAQPIEATNIQEKNYWAIRVVDADKNVPLRTWTVEAAIAQTGNSVLCGARLFCVTRGENKSFLRSTPGFVRQIMEKFDVAIDNWPVPDEPWYIKSKAATAKLVNLICDTNRKHDVFVISTNDEDDDFSSVIVSPEKIFSRTLGAAHVAVISSKAAFALTEKLGKKFSVFRQGVRTYRPEFDLEQSQPHDHPLALGHRIAGWSGGSQEFEDMLVEGCLRDTVNRRDRDQRLPPYHEAKRVAQEEIRESRRQGKTSIEQRLEFAIRERDEIRKELDELYEESEGVLRQVELDREHAIDEKEEAKSLAQKLKSRISYLETALKRAQSKKSKPRIPDNFSELEHWAEIHLAGKVMLHNKAIRAAKKSKFDNVPLAYRALLVLRDHYVPMRLEGRGRTNYEKALTSLHLVDQASFSSSRSGEQGDEYFIQFNGRKREMDRHLKGSNSRDPKFGFRLYFFWDDDTEQVVVGSLPNHLNTRIT